MSGGNQFDELLKQMPLVAQEVNRFTTPELQRVAYNDLMARLGHGETRAVIVSAVDELGRLISMWEQQPPATRERAGTVGRLTVEYLTHLREHLGQVLA